MKVYSWGRKGWNGQEKEIKVTTRSKIPYEQTEFSSEGKKDSMSMLGEISTEIQISNPLEKIDALPTALKYVYQSPDDFYLSKNGKLFRVVDPITQVYQYGEWGADRDESDHDVLGESKNTLREWLERSRVIDPMDDTEAMFDRMEYIASNEELNDHYINQKENIGTILPAISDEKVEEVQKAQLVYKQDIANSADSKQIELLTLAFEQKLDSILNEEMTLSLSSPFTANRYSQPSKKFEFILTEGHSNLTEHKHGRESFFFDLFKEIEDCNSLDSLYGPVSPIDGGRCFEDGIMYKISNMYNHDKQICIDWSINSIKNEKGVVTQESALITQAKEYMKELRTQGVDEELLRRKVNSKFFNKQCTIPAKYDSDGNIISQTIKIKDSWFHKNRAIAMQDLFLTKAQWAGIYQLIDIIKKKAKFRIANEDEREAAKILKEQLSSCKTLKDLGNYRHNAEKREFIYKSNDDGVRFNTYKFEPSLVDRLSKVNEQRWLREVIKKHREIVAKGIKNGK